MQNDLRCYIKSANTKIDFSLVYKFFAKLFVIYINDNVMNKSWESIKELYMDRSEDILDSKSDTVLDRLERIFFNRQYRVEDVSNSLLRFE